RAYGGFIAAHAWLRYPHEAGRLVGFLRSRRLALLAQAVADGGDILCRRSVRPRRIRSGDDQRESERQQQTTDWHVPHPFFPALTSSNVASARSNLELKSHIRSEEHTSELQSLAYLVCRLLL